MIRKGRPTKVKKGDRYYPLKNFYYPLDLRYAKVWSYFETTLLNYIGLTRAAFIRTSLFKLMNEVLDKVDIQKGLTDEDREIKTIILELIEEERKQQ